MGCNAGNQEGTLVTLHMLLYLGQIALQEGLCGEALSLHADFDCPGICEGSLGYPHAS